MDVPNEVLQDMLTYVEKSSALLEESGRVHVEMQKRAPDLAEALVKAGLLDEKSRFAAVAKLQEPLTLMDSLQKTAEHVSESVPSMGGPSKEADDKTLDNKASIKESDRAYYARLGFSVA